MTSCNAMTRAREVSFTNVMISLEMGGDDSLDHLQQGDVAEDLGFGHAQDLACLLLALRHSLDAAPVDLGEVAGVIDDEGHTPAIIRPDSPLGQLNHFWMPGT